MALPIAIGAGLSAAGLLASLASRSSEEDEALRLAKERARGQGLAADKAQAALRASLQSAARSDTGHTPNLALRRANAQAADAAVQMAPVQAAEQGQNLALFQQGAAQDRDRRNRLLAGGLSALSGFTGMMAGGKEAKMAPVAEAAGQAADVGAGAAGLGTGGAGVAAALGGARPVLTSLLGGLGGAVQGVAGSEPGQAATAPTSLQAAAQMPQGFSGQGLHEQVQTGAPAPEEQAALMQRQPAPQPPQEQIPLTAPQNPYDASTPTGAAGAIGGAVDRAASLGSLPSPQQRQELLRQNVAGMSPEAADGLRMLMGRGFDSLFLKAPNPFLRER